MTAEKQMELAGYLVVNSGTPDAYFFELENGKVLEIGRKPGSPTGPRKLVLPVPEVSSLHSELRPGPEGWSIRDMNSTNGTRLNGNWLTAGQEYLLKNGDHIKVAQIDLIVNLPESSPQRSDVPEKEDEHERTQLHIKLMTATILVADIRAFTTLSEHYSAAPNIVMQAAQKVFSRFHDEIQRNHGQVEKIAGDAVMAYWQGDDRPGEEHTQDNICAYQACYAALKIKESVPHIGASSDWPFPDYPLQVDIALATGPVATGVLGGGKSAMAVLGDTANLAFRIEKLIGVDRPGDIIMDGSTHELIQLQYNCESMGSQAVKGRQKPVDLWRLLSLKS